MQTTLTRRYERCFAELQTRHGRKKSGFCFCEGVRCCEEVLNSPAAADIELVVVAEGIQLPYLLDAALPVAAVDASTLEKLSGTVNPQGILILLKRPSTAPRAELANPDPFIFAVDQLGDPGNFGTILRTARAAGLKEFYYTSASVDPFSPKVIRSALGAQFAMTLREFPDLAALSEFARQQGYNTTYLTDPHQGESCFECEKLFDRSLIVIGSEAHGVGDAAEGTRVTIPMPGNFESLNAAQAATIFLFEYVRRITKA